MTNSEKVLERWESLKGSLSKLIYLSKHKELIKDALEIYLNSTSTFFSNHSGSKPQGMPTWGFIVNRRRNF